MVLREQPDRAELIKVIAKLLSRLASLYQLPNWTADNSVLLAEWVFDNYKYESLEDVMTCLSNPPAGENTTWRLTPDTIRAWMSAKLEKTALKREKEMNDMKAKELGSGPLEKVDYESFKRRLPDFLKKEDKRKGDEGYLAFRNKYIADKLKNKPDGQT